MQHNHEAHYLFSFSGNYYGTPKPPAEPSPVQPDLVDQVLFDEEFETEVQRKRTTSVSKMERKDSAAPEEEDDEDRPALVNGLTGEMLLLISVQCFDVRLVSDFCCGLRSRTVARSSEGLTFCVFRDAFPITAVVRSLGFDL